MSAPPLVPVLPDSAPFTAAQRAYLNGFLAGLFSRAAHPEMSHFNSRIPEAKPLVPLTVLFGSQTGNAENLARRIAKEAGQRGFAATVHDLAKYPTAQLASERHLLVVTSTFGDGEPPDNAKAFWDFLSSDAAPKLPELRFSVCALGDSNYPKFCAFGKNLDERLERLGGRRVHPRADCDGEFEAPFTHWLAQVWSKLLDRGSPQPSSAREVNPVEAGSVAGVTSESARGAAPSQTSASFSRSHPFPAPLLANRRLNGPRSSKDTRHFEFSLEGSALSYEVGDALGVLPRNCPELVGEIIRALNCRPTDAVSGKDGQPVPLHDALFRHYDITKIPQPLLQAVAERSGDETLLKLVAPGVNGELTQFLRGREIIDLLLAFPAVKFAPGEFVALLKKLHPRLYSISSSPKAHPGRVHLCVSVVRYESLGRSRKGVCSTFLADRVEPDTPVPVFVHTNKHFRLPPAGDTPMIMVGPGTGIAPFRAFLHERQAAGAKGRNWLFFGDQHAATDFLYREELEGFLHDGTLTRLDTAFSRDQPEKIYVQHRMLEHARELFAWLEAGAHFYVCGDAGRMAKDVDKALHQIIERGGGRTPEQAADYVRELHTQQRHQRDVY
jgi:sulfite reductase (NADPH) flavoprotein alpha-component